MKKEDFLKLDLSSMDDFELYELTLSFTPEECLRLDGSKAVSLGRFAAKAASAGRRYDHRIQVLSSFVFDMFSTLCEKGRKDEAKQIFGYGRDPWIKKFLEHDVFGSQAVKSKGNAMAHAKEAGYEWDGVRRALAGSNVGLLDKAFALGAGFEFEGVAAKSPEADLAVGLCMCIASPARSSQDFGIDTLATMRTFCEPSVWREAMGRACAILKASRPEGPLSGIGRLAPKNASNMVERISTLMARTKGLELSGEERMALLEAAKEFSTPKANGLDSWRQAAAGAAFGGDPSVLMAIVEMAGKAGCDVALDSFHIAGPMGLGGLQRSASTSWLVEACVHAGKDACALALASRMVESGPKALPGLMSALTAAAKRGGPGADGLSKAMIMMAAKMFLSLDPGAGRRAAADKAEDLASKAIGKASRGAFRDSSKKAGVSMLSIAASADLASWAVEDQNPSAEPVAERVRPSKRL